MKIYRLNGETMPHRIHVTPGFFHPEVYDWINPETKKPICFIVMFKNGMAEVPDSLGRYMLDNKLAQASPLILAADENILDFNLYGEEYAVA